MRVALDENVPVELADELPDHEVVHVKDLAVIQLRPPRLVMDQVRTMIPAIEAALRSAKPGAVAIIRPDVD